MRLAAVLALGLLAPSTAGAIPAFARRYEVACSTCHLGRFPRLNAWGERFRERGFQLPDGAEDEFRARRTVEPGTLAERLGVFKEVPLGVRAEVFGVAPVDAQSARPAFDFRLAGFLFGGGSVHEDVSAFFSVGLFPEPSLHHARLAVHDVAARWIGEGTLNFRAGALLLLDFLGPNHRLYSGGATASEDVAVGLNRFNLGAPTLGVNAYGRPGWGPLFWELAVVAGDPGEGTERDDWKDLFLRAHYTLFLDSDHELGFGAFGYLGRSEILTSVAGAQLALRDDFWIAGGELGLTLWDLELRAMGYARRHSDPTIIARPIALYAARIELSWLAHRDLTASVRVDGVLSSDDPALDARALVVHLAYAVASNAMLAFDWRQDLVDFDGSLAILTGDVTF